ncbi:uncharacterized protein [Procambarus clarkii]|uniref:uncharacterized protein isoform X1 n=1 Tax=Procambarus clarkii TaxID=6728 RepID=UPI003744762E
MGDGSYFEWGSPYKQLDLYPSDRTICLASCTEMCSTCLTSVFGTSMGGVGFVLGCNYWQSENLIFRTVGADSLRGVVLRLESNYFFTVAVMLSPGHVAFILLAITQTALSKEENLIAECRYAASAGSLIVHIVLIYLLVRCYRNFGLGLKEKVYPRQTTTTGVQSSLVQ